MMEWKVLFHESFKVEFYELSEEVQDRICAHTRLLENFGPQLGRPRVDTLNDSRYANMKELRFDAEHGVWPLLLTRNDKPFYWSPTTNQESARNVFTSN